MDLPVKLISLTLCFNFLDWPIECFSNLFFFNAMKLIVTDKVSFVFLICSTVCEIKKSEIQWNDWMGTISCLFLELHIPYQTIVVYTTSQQYTASLYPHTLLTSRVAIWETDHLDNRWLKESLLGSHDWKMSVMMYSARLGTQALSFVFNFWSCFRIGWNLFLSMGLSFNITLRMLLSLFRRILKLLRSSLWKFPFVQDPGASCPLCFGTAICHHVLLHSLGWTFG